MNAVQTNTKHRTFSFGSLNASRFVSLGVVYALFIILTVVSLF